MLVQEMKTSVVIFSEHVASCLILLCFSPTSPPTNHVCFDIYGYSLQRYGFMHLAAKFICMYKIYISILFYYLYIYFCAIHHLRPRRTGVNPCSCVSQGGQSGRRCVDVSCCYQQEVCSTGVYLCYWHHWFDSLWSHTVGILCTVYSISLRA